MIMDVSDENFHSTTQEGVCLILFHMQHCQGCITLLPTLMRIETQLPFIKLVRADIDACPKTSHQYHVHQTPTLFFSKDGKLEAYTGERSIMNIRAALGKLLYAQE